MSTDWLGLEGKRAIVAGAGGIGGAIAVSLAEAGAQVVVLDVNREALDEISQPGGHGVGPISGVQGDLSSADACRAALAEAVELLDGLDLFVHAVGINDRRPVLEITDEVWNKVTTINLSSGFWLGQAAGAHMTAAGYGRIVFLSSVSGLLAHANHSPYAASKGGINQLMRVMAREWAPSGVTVNAIAPGYTETALTREYLEKPGILAPMLAQVPAGRLGTTDDLTGPALFLLSDQAAFVTGHVVYVDGGRTLV